MSVAVDRAVAAALIGVPSPRPFSHRGITYRFNTLGGVAEDLDWYESLIKGAIPASRLTFHRWETPKLTESASLRGRLKDAAEAVSPGGLFLLVLCGHGFQATDDNGDEPDGLDEVFAASDGPILDDEFGEIWDSIDEATDVVVIVDSCSADSLGIRGGLSVEPVIAFKSAGPARLSISASMAWEKAAEVQTRHGVRGVLSLALEDAWTDPDARTSHLAWFRAAAELLAVRRPQQHPRLRYLGPDDRLLLRAPLT